MRIGVFRSLLGRRLAWASLAFFVLLLQLSACSAGHAAVRVTVTTSLLESVVKDIGGKHVDVHVLIAPGSCPGHHDLVPQDVKNLASSQLVIMHGYEKFVDKALASIGGKKPEKAAVGVSGSWLIPAKYHLGAKKVTEILCKQDPKHANDYKASLRSLGRKCKSLTDQIKRQAIAHNVKGAKVLCSNQQSEFVEWLGFEVIASYGRTEELTPQLMHSMNKLGKSKKTRIVIDNLQSGPTTGKELAKHIGAKHVTISNFPGGYAKTDTWSKCLMDNVNRILEELK